MTIPKQDNAAHIKPSYRLPWRAAATNILDLLAAVTVALAGGVSLANTITSHDLWFPPTQTVWAAVAVLLAVALSARRLLRAAGRP